MLSSSKFIWLPSDSSEAPGASISPDHHAAAALNLVAQRLVQKSQSRNRSKCANQMNWNVRGLEACMKGQVSPSTFGADRLWRCATIHHSGSEEILCIARCVYLSVRLHLLQASKYSKLYGP